MHAHAKRRLAQAAAAVVGVDAGKFHHALVVRPRGHADSRPLIFPTTRPGFEQAVRFIRAQAGESGGEVLVGIEFAGSYGFTFAHFLRSTDERFMVVSVLPAHTKRWKEVTHRQPLKTDAKDAVGICDLAAQGHFVAFPFLAVLRRESRNHLKREAYERLIEAATHTVALPNAQGVMKDEIPLLIARLDLYEQQMHTLERTMGGRLAELPAARALLTIPTVAPVSAAVFLGSIGDPHAYDSARQVIALAGLTLVERSSGVVRGEKRISKRGRAVLRKHAHMFAVRSVHTNGIFRRPYEALLARNGRRPFAALTAIARKGLRLFYAVARSERPWTPDMPPRSGAGETSACV
jgi:transposase